MYFLKSAYVGYAEKLALWFHFIDEETEVYPWQETQQRQEQKHESQHPGSLVSNHDTKPSFCQSFERRMD